MSNTPITMEDMEIIEERKIIRDLSSNVAILTVKLDHVEDSLEHKSEQIDLLCSKIDTMMDKLSELTVDMSKMILTHEHRLNNMDDHLKDIKEQLAQKRQHLDDIKEKITTLAAAEKTPSPPWYEAPWIKPVFAGLFLAIVYVLGNMGKEGSFLAFLLK